MAIRNPQANFNWRIDLANVVNGRCQMVTPPTVELAEHKQGSQGTSPDAKTPGKKIVGDLVIEMLVPQNGGDGEIWDALRLAQTMQKALYAGDGFLYETDPNGAPVNTFKIDDAWIKKIETSNYETTSDNSGDLKRTVTFSVRDYNRI